MRHWFLSFNSQDLALMQGLEAALRRKDAPAGRDQPERLGSIGSRPHSHA
jgi:hypothetical protein